MIRPSTEQVIHDLTRNVDPVRPIPSLRAVALAVAAAWAVAVLGMAIFSEMTLDLVRSIPWRDPKFALVLFGLGAVAAGATLSALARAVPGREYVARAGAGAALLGITLASLGGLWAAVGSSPRFLDDLTSSAACMSHAGALALAPVVVVSLFLARGLTLHPLLTSGLAAAGTAALGGLVIHATCRIGGSLHMLMGHALAPLALGFLLAVPVSLLVRVWRQRLRRE